MPVTLLTLVSNHNGYGPGHSAVAIDGTVYSFEDIGNIGSDGSGWISMSLAKYLKKNAFRPVILQQLTSAVDPGKALQFINNSIANDDDYLGSGVCSSGAAGAIEAGYGKSVNTLGVDRPYEIYQLVKKLGIVASERTEWADKATIDAGARERCQSLLDQLAAGSAPTTFVEDAVIPVAATVLLGPVAGALAGIFGR